MSIWSRFRQESSRTECMTDSDLLVPSHDPGGDDHFTRKDNSTMSRTSRDVVDLGTLIVQGDDRQGIVAAVSSLLAKYGANIVSLDQHSTDPAGGRFFQRTTFHLEDLPAQIPSLSDELDNVLGMLGQSYRLTEARKPKRVAIMVSKTDHCLLDLLWRQRRGEIHMNVGMVIANHPDLGDDVRGFGIPFIHIPVNRASRAQAEAEQLKLLTDNVDLVVLARYMQILSGDFLQAGGSAGNQHSSLIPARFHRCRAVSEGERSRRQADRRDRPLRDRGPRRRPDHRAGRRAGLPRGDCWLTSSGEVPMSSVRSCRGPWRGTARTG